MSDVAPQPNVTAETSTDRYYLASQWQLMGRKFFRHRLAMIGMVALGILYFVALFAEFFATQDIYKKNTDYLYAPPQRIRFIGTDGFSVRPFVYQLTPEVNVETYRTHYQLDTSKKEYLQFFRHGDSYKLWGVLNLDIHFISVEQGTMFLMGSDKFGRDLFSRLIYAARTSLSIGLIGVAMTFLIGCSLGGVSGFFGGSVDMIVQRLIEFMQSIPTIPLWLALSAAMPRNWGTLQIYLAITVILSIVSWGGLARVVRGKLLQLREEDFVMAARISGAASTSIIVRHLLPSFLSYLIVSVTLSVPGMILGETALSFLGLGLREPTVSWGVLLKSAQNIRSIALHPWMMTPALFVIITVLSFNFVGDGLRDAADPYKSQ